MLLIEERRWARLGTLSIYFTLLFYFPSRAAAPLSQSFQCQAALVSHDGLVKDESKKPLQIIGKKGVPVPAFSKISRANIDSIFRHQYDPKNLNKFGAKAVAVKIPSYGVMVWFFPTGEGVEGYNVHHRDALASMLALGWGKVRRQWRMADNNVMKAFEGKEALYVDTFGESFQRVYERHQSFDTIVSDAEKIKERGQNESYRNGMLHVLMSSAQGFQLTAEKINGQLMITEFNIDSSITSFQNRFGLFDDFGAQPELLEETLEGISKKLRKFP